MPIRPRRETGWRIGFFYGMRRMEGTYRNAVIVSVDGYRKSTEIWLTMVTGPHCARYACPSRHHRRWSNRASGPPSKTSGARRGNSLPDALHCQRGRYTHYQVRVPGQMDFHKMMLLAERFAAWETTIHQFVKGYESKYLNAVKSWPAMSPDCWLTSSCGARTGTLSGARTQLSPPSPPQ